MRKWGMIVSAFYAVIVLGLHFIRGSRIHPVSMRAHMGNRLVTLESGGLSRNGN